MANSFFPFITSLLWYKTLSTTSTCVKNTTIKGKIILEELGSMWLNIDSREKKIAWSMLVAYTQNWLMNAV
jgi:hypothetical protein